jgi:indole-3-glycerol phosphate synthase
MVYAAGDQLVTGILQRIVSSKRRTVKKLQRVLPLDSFRDTLASLPPSRFKQTLQKAGRINIIAEIKKGSPSRGILIADFDPGKLAGQYRDGGACALSVLTEENYFHGRAEYMETARRESGLPVLCKDFIIDTYQIYYAKLMKADAVLLITALHTEQTLKEFICVAASMELDCLVEVHDENELDVALNAGAGIVGVNNRNLIDFSVALETSEKLAPGVPDTVIKVAESGISTPADINRLETCGYNCFLIGEVLVTASDPVRLLRTLRKA